MSSAKGEIIFLGTGTSEGVPRVTCLTRDPPTCKVCLSAVAPGSKNRRRNTSLLIRRPHPDGRTRNIVIDVGKFFWEAAMEWFVRYRVPSIDAVVLTHSHADAVGGMDNLRDWTNNVQKSIPIYLRAQDMDAVSRMHFYLVDRRHVTGGGGVAKLGFHIIGKAPFEVEGVRLTPLTVWHGPSYTALGYRFGNVSYISDTSGIPEATERLMEGTELLVLDALRPRRTHGSHFTLEEAIETVERLRPHRALLTDMTHDYDHEAVNEEMARLKATKGIDVQLAYDGLRIPVDLD